MLETELPLRAPNDLKREIINIAKKNFGNQYLELGGNNWSFANLSPSHRAFARRILDLESECFNELPENLREETFQPDGPSIGDRELFSSGQYNALLHWYHKQLAIPAEHLNHDTMSLKYKDQWPIPVPDYNKISYVRTGSYKTGDLGSIKEEKFELSYRGDVMPLIGAFISDQLDLILRKDNRSLSECPFSKKPVAKTAGRFSCMGATNIWEKGRIYFAGFRGNTLLTRDGLVSAADVIKDYSIFANIHEYKTQYETNPYDTPHLDSVLYLVIDKNFTNRSDAICYFAQFLKDINAIDQKSGDFAQGHSPDPLNPDYIISVGGIPYFVNISHPFESHDHQSSVPGILFVPQAVFEHQKLRVQGKSNEFKKWQGAIRKNLDGRYGEVYPGLNDNGSTSPIANFLFYNESEVERIAKILGCDAKGLRALID